MSFKCLKVSLLNSEIEACVCGAKYNLKLRQESGPPQCFHFPYCVTEEARMESGFHNV